MNKQITVFSGVLTHHNKILMIKRLEEELPAANLRWEFPGGKCDFDETPQEALKREFLEETGIEIEVGELLPFVQTVYWEYPWGKQQTLCFVFQCRLIKEGKRSKDHHVLDTHWFTKDEIKRLKTLPGTEEVVRLINFLAE